MGNQWWNKTELDYIKKGTTYLNDYVNTEIGKRYDNSKKSNFSGGGGGEWTNSRVVNYSKVLNPEDGLNLNKYNWRESPQQTMKYVNDILEEGNKGVYVREGNKVTKSPTFNEWLS